MQLWIHKGIPPQMKALLELAGDAGESEEFFNMITGGPIAAKCADALSQGLREAANSLKHYATRADPKTMFEATWCQSIKETLLDPDGMKLSEDVEQVMDGPS